MKYDLNNIPKTVKYFFLGGIYSEPQVDLDGNLITADNSGEVEEIKKIHPAWQVVKNN